MKFNIIRFSRAAQKARWDLDLSIAQVAEAANLSVAAVGSLERLGKRTLWIDTVLSICTTLGLNINDFIEEDGNAKN